MSRVINPNTPGKERNKVKKALALAVRELMQETEPGDRARDLAAFMVLSLAAISRTVETTVTAWEKRDYWVKADRFRLEWDWSARLGRELRPVVLAEDWEAIVPLAVQIGQHLGDVKVSKHHRMGTPWVGAWKELTADE